MIGDFFKFSLNNLRVRKLRTSLTMIGIFIGIAAVVALISLGQGMQEAIDVQFQKLGVDRITVSAGGVQFGPPGSGLAVTKLTEDDLEVVRKVRGVEQATAIFGETTDVRHNGETEFLAVWGGYTDKKSLEFTSEIGFFDIEEGREIKAGDRYKAVIGYNIAHETFDIDMDIGDDLEISGHDFEIVGIQKKAGTGIHDALIRVSIDIARDLFNETEEVSQIFLATEKGVEPIVVAERIEKDLRKFRGLEEGEEDFTVATSEQNIQQLTQILLMVQVFLVGIAAISLVVGGIGIMNTMYTSVMEKSREIGIMKAVGAKNSHIFWLYLIESGLLGMAGGGIGVIIGLSLSKITEIIVLQYGIEIFKASFNPLIIFGALAFSFFVGSISGVLPALQASKLHPVEAIRKH